MSQVGQSTIELPHGVSILCPGDGQLEMPFTVESTEGYRVVCHDARSLVTTIGMALANYEPGTKRRNGKQGSGPERAWQEAADYAQAYNAGRPESEHISDDEARKILARMKRLKKAESLLKTRDDRGDEQSATPKGDS